MSEAEVVTNFNNTEDLKTVVYDTEAVSDYTWHLLQAVQRESLHALLPRNEWDRADALVRLDDFETYRDRRVDPNLQAGQDGWNAEQIFKKPLLAVTLDRSNRVIGGVLTANNASGSKNKPRPVWLTEAWAKMITPPGVAVPKIGGKRYVHLREAYVHPDAQEALDVEDDVSVVSGIALVGIYFSLAQRHTQQEVGAYIVPADPADAELVDIAQVLVMRTTGERPNTISGYKDESQLVRVQAQVGQVMRTIMGMPGADRAINSADVTRVTVRSVKAKEREVRKRNEKAEWRDFDARQETKARDERP